MNERIKEFAEQAQKIVGYTDGGYTKIKALDQEKFAELIVQECANQCTTDGPFGAEVVWGKQFHDKILEHFGVE